MIYIIYASIQNKLALLDIEPIAHRIEHSHCCLKSFFLKRCLLLGWIAIAWRDTAKGRRERGGDDVRERGGDDVLQRNQIKKPRPVQGDRANN